MKITCDKCGASYKIPEEKLTRDVSKATCKKCGEKIIIRKPAGGDYEDPRITRGLQSSLEDEGVVEHNEERTVIAVVPELQRFDATPPLASSPGHSDMTPAVPVAPPTAPARPATPTPAPAAPVAPASSAPATAASGTWAPVAAPAPMATAPVPPVAAPSVAASAASAAAPAKPVPARARARAGASPLAIPPLIVALIGLFCFVPDARWGLANFQAAGFTLSLFGSLAAIVVQVGLIRTGLVNMMLGFLLPSVGVVGLAATLLNMQEVPFLTEGVKEDLELIILTARQPTAPDAPSLTERVAKRRNATATRRNNPPSGGGTVDVSGINPNQTGTGPEVAGLKPDSEGPAGVTTGEGPGTSGALPTTSRSPGRPSGNIGGVASAQISFDDEKIGRLMNGSAMKACFQSSLQGQALPSRLEVSFMLSPEGSARDLQIRNDALSGSALEKCLASAVARTKFPTHDSTKVEKYKYTYIN
ncbi:MAG: zinc-ribbon domain-containing protein [Myxococcota bacterium]